MRDFLSDLKILNLKLALAVVLLFFPIANAADLFCPAQPPRAPASETKPNGVTVIQLDAKLPIEPLARDGYRVETYDQFYHGDAWADPSPSLRDQIYREVGVSRFVRGWDQFEQDRLFLRAQSYAPSRLSSKYVHIPPTVLQNLQKLIQKRKAIEIQKTREAVR